MGCYMLRINDENLEYKHIMYDETIFFNEDCTL